VCVCWEGGGDGGEIATEKITHTSLFSSVPVSGRSFIELFNSFLTCML
jgi:hypothetical protein